MHNQPLNNRFHYYPRLNPNPNSEVFSFCTEPSPSPSPSVSPSPSPSVSPSPSPVNRVFTLSCPVYPQPFGDPQTDLVLTLVEDTGVINAPLNSWFYLSGPAISGCGKVTDLNPNMELYKSSPYSVGFDPLASPPVDVGYIDFGTFSYTPQPSGEAPCLTNHPCA